MKRYDHIPTLEEAKQAQKDNGLHESYWWITGWNFNRPVIGHIGIGADILEGAYVWLHAGDNAPSEGWKSEDLKGIPFVFVGPIECPHDSLNVAS